MQLYKIGYINIVNYCLAVFIDLPQRVLRITIILRATDETGLVQTAEFNEPISGRSKTFYVITNHLVLVELVAKNLNS